MARLDPRQRKPHFWRDSAGHEVDFILEEAGKLVALEIKARSQVTTSDATEIRAFRDDFCLLYTSFEIDRLEITIFLRFL